MMYYKLCWQTQDGRVDSRKLATTAEKAREWVTQNNELYQDMKHWVEEVTFKQGTQQTGLTQ